MRPGWWACPSACAAPPAPLRRFKSGEDVEAKGGGVCGGGGDDPLPLPQPQHSSRQEAAAAAARAKNQAVVSWVDDPPV